MDNTTDPITWLDFLEEGLPEPRVPFKSLSLPAPTHEPAKSANDRFGAPTEISTTNPVLTFNAETRLLISSIHMNADPATIPPRKPYFPIFLNEQSVAEAIFHNVLAPIQQLLDYLLRGSPKHAAITAGQYMINIRAQQRTKEEATRCDHCIVLEHVYGLPRGRAPERLVLWDSLEEFKRKFTEFEAAVQNQTDVPKDPGPPRLVLCVIEEKVGIFFRQSGSTS
ncbi:hypothetical protein EW146_g10395, partial [Bondarzewia mesenterica]